MKLLVTGGSGFIGSNFILNLLNNSNEFFIKNIDDERHGSNNRNLKTVENHKNYEFIKGNITDEKLIDRLVSNSDIVVNFAAESHVDRSIENARPFIDSNIVGVFTILESIKKYQRQFIQISTDEVFGSLKVGSADENTKLNPSSPYSSSKASAELLIKSYIVTYGLDAKITRCTNNYGPRQFPEKLIPKTIILAKNNKKIPVYGNGKNIRDWIYVDDHCDAILDVINNGKNGESYNISAANEIDNLTVIKKILSIMGKSEDLIEFVNDRPGHDFRYSLDSSKIRNEIKWKTKYSFEERLEQTVEWYQNNESWWKNLEIKNFNFY
jgi:dTDP-glucose 4,6-dehydratase